MSLCSPFNIEDKHNIYESFRIFTVLLIAIIEHNYQMKISPQIHTENHQF